MDINIYLLFFFLFSFVSVLFFEGSRFFILILYFLLAGIYVPPDWVETFRNLMTHARWYVLAFTTGASLIGVFFARGKIAKFNLFFLYLTPFFLCILISVSYSTNPQVTLFKATSVFLMLLSIYALWCCRKQDFVKTIRAYHRNLLFYVIFILVVNSISSFFENSYFAIWNYFRGIFANPNTIGLLAGVFCIPVMTHYFLSQKSLIKKVAALIFWSVSFVMLWSSHSRAGALSAIAGVLVFVLFYLRKRWVALIFFLALSAGGVVYETQPQLIQGIREEWVLKNRKPQEGMLSSRMEPWAQSLSKAKSQLWAGYGFGMVADFSESWESRVESEVSTRPRGSSYLAIIEEVGLLGLSMFFIIAIYLLNPLRMLKLRQKLPGQEFGLVLLFYSITIAGFANALFEDWLFSVGWITTLLFWHTAAASTGFGKLEHS